MKTIKYIGILFLTLVITASCNTSDELSLQEYYVNSENNSNYLMLDIPTSILNLDANATEDVKQAYESINKVNLLAFKLTNKNGQNYKEEKAKITKILKNPAYTELMRVNRNGSKIIAKYLGSENAMKEVIIFASDKTKGFALARVLGNDMRPENMIKLLNELKSIDKDSEAIKKMKGFFGAM